MLLKSIILIKNGVIHHSYRYMLTHTHSHTYTFTQKTWSPTQFHTVKVDQRTSVFVYMEFGKKKSMQHIWLYMCHSVFRTQSALLAQTHSMHGARLFVEPILVFGLVNMRNTLPSVMFFALRDAHNMTPLFWLFGCSLAAENSIKKYGNNTNTLPSVQNYNYF